VNRFSVVVSTHEASFEAVAFKGSVYESLASVAEAGYDGAELAVRNAAEVDGRRLRDRALELKLEIPAIGTGQMWGEERLSLTSEDESVRSQTQDRLTEHVRLAAELDSLVIIGLVRGVFPRPELTEQSFDWLADGLGAIGRIAQQAGVRIALEAINRYETAYVNTLAEGLELLDRVGCDAVGMLLDTFHMNIEEPSITESFRLCGDHLFHVHVADSNRWYPGAGHIDFSDVLATLNELGYRGYVSGEFLPLPDGPSSIRMGIRNLRRIAANLTES
jgi:5-keto-L-gluconate epimerase